MYLGEKYKNSRQTTDTVDIGSSGPLSRALLWINIYILSFLIVYVTINWCVRKTILSETSFIFSSSFLKFELDAFEKRYAYNERFQKLFLIILNRCHYYITPTRAYTIDRQWRQLSNFKTRMWRRDPAAATFVFSRALTLHTSGTWRRLTERRAITNDE